MEESINRRKEKIFSKGLYVTCLLTFDEQAQQQKELLRSTT